MIKGNIIRWGLTVALLSIAFYSLRGDDTIPDFALDAVHLLKKPIEDLLPDLQETETEQNIEQATLDLEPYQDLKNSRERWNEMRALIESGQPLSQPLPSEIAVSTSPIGRLAPAVPPPPGFTVQLPYESRLTVSGRKTIGFTYQNTTYANSNYAITQGLPVSQSSFLLQQQLQVRINGQIGRKVTVNVDFDDTKTDKQDISIVYKGDPDELVQKAAFGDITLSLPQTEFVGYSKQVFGASAELKYKALHAYVIGSRTKGTTETKQFTGDVILQRINVPDISYVRYKYFNYLKLANAQNDKVAPGNIASFVSNFRVYVDNRDITRSSATFSTRITQVDLSSIPNLPAGTPTIWPPPGSTINAGFVQQAPGIDYTIDPSSGLITFKNPLPNNAVVAIDYQEPGSGQVISADPARGANAGLPKAVKWDEAAVLAIPASEDLQHYSIGATNIVRDDGQGNFILQLRDLGNNPIGQNVGIQYLPNNAGQIIVDFVGGTFYLTTPLPAAQFGGVYSYSPTTQSSFYVEFRSTVKSYTLRPNIVINSEHITLDGRVLTRDADYFIDYQSGFLTFYNPSLITPTSVITATYDFSPFGIAGAQQDTLVGERVEASMYPVAPILANSSIGSTVLYDFAPAQTTAPDIRQTAGSFLVSEGDIHFKDLIFNPIPFLKSSFTGEVARSQRNPNTFGKALIDNMEGIADDASIGMSVLNWQVASNPNRNGVQDGPAFANAMGIYHVPAQTGDNLVNEAIPTLSINPNAAALSGDLTQVLDINYNLTQSTQASIATVISATGIDLSKKLYVEMYIQGDGSVARGAATGTQMNVSLGQIDEDADGTRGGGFTDINGPHTLGDGTPRTEDLNRNNILDQGEDVGWTYNNPGNANASAGCVGPNCQIGAGNLRLDSEDLNRNGTLDAENTNVGGSIGYYASDPFNQTINFPGSSGPNAVDHQNWEFVRVPLEINSSDTVRWSQIMEMRISLRAGGGARTGTIRIAKITITGSKWRADVPFLVNQSTITVLAVNTEDDSAPPPAGRGYVSPAGFGDFDDLNQINTAISGPVPAKRREQSLAIDYQFASGTPAISSVTARSVTTAAMDFTSYGSIKFFLYAHEGAGNNEIFFYRVGTDTDYFEYSSTVTLKNQWQEITIFQRSSSGGQRADTWSLGGAPPGPGETVCTPTACIRRVGNPNLSNVQQMLVGVQSNSTTGITGELWVDEIFASDVITRIGYASKAQSDFEIFGWATFGAAVRNVDQNFETFTSPVTDQAVRDQTAYLNLTRLQFFPMHFTSQQRTTVTPNVNQTGNSSLVSSLSQGRVDDKKFGGNGTLQIPAYPKLGFTYDTDKTDTSALFRIDKTDHYGVTFDYTVPGNHRFMPKTVLLSYKRTNYELDYGMDAITQNQASDLALVAPQTLDKTNEYSGKLSFQPLPGFTFNPMYTLSETNENKPNLDQFIQNNSTVAVSTVTLPSSYTKNRMETLGFDGVLSFKKWLAPRVRYTMNDNETFGIPLAADPNAAALKNVDRTSTGEVAWDFSYRDFSTRIRSLQSLNIVSSYLIEDGDSWNNVPSGYNSLKLLSVRDPLQAGGNATRANLTLRDTFRSTQRWSPFDWATSWSGAATPLRTLNVTSTLTDIHQRQETTGTPAKILTTIYPDLILSLTQTEYFFHLQRIMSNSQMNIKSQYKRVDTINTSYEKASSNGGDWRFTLYRKLDVFFSYTRTTDNVFDEVNHVEASDANGSTLSAQLGFNVGKWRITPKYDQSIQKATNASGQLTTDLTTRTPALQVYADLFLPAGLRLPFSDLVVFSNRIRTTDTVSYSQKRSSLGDLQNNTDTYSFTTSEDYEMTSNIRLTVGGTYSYTANRASSAANFYSYQFNTLMTIQF